MPARDALTRRVAWVTSVGFDRPSGAEPFGFTTQRAADHGPLLPCLITLLCLLPFVGKAFHIDDPLFIWSAQQIARDPLDFYGCQVNWYGITSPLHEVAQNPPLASYYLAIVGSAFGWSEKVLHTAFLAPAIAAILGAYAVARRCGADARWCALVTLASPAFLVSATNVMCDVMMLAWWCCGLWMWIRAVDGGRWTTYLAAGVLFALAALTKYFAVALIPLAAIYALYATQRIGGWLVWLMLPVGILAAFEIWCRGQYGHGFLLGAAGYTSYFRSIAQIPIGTQCLVAVIFMGGCLPMIWLYAPWIWSRVGIAVLVIGTIAIAGGLYWTGNMSGLKFRTPNGPNWLPLVTATVFCAGGLQVVALALSELLHAFSREALVLASRQPLHVPSGQSGLIEEQITAAIRTAVQRQQALTMLMVLWILGTIVFAIGFNWTVNGRTILPAVPPCAILMSLRLRRRALEKATVAASTEVGASSPQSAKWSPFGVTLRWAPVAAMLALSLWLAWADYRLAASARIAAQSIWNQYGSSALRVWFQGHWGFQYYLQAAGGVPLDMSTDVAQPGEVIVAPYENTSVYPMPTEYMDLLGSVVVPTNQGVATVSRALKASFYASVLGPLPYAFGNVEPQYYSILMPKSGIRFNVPFQ